ncbi:MAG TPA: alpha-glucosidase [Terriglobales bacterium]
MRKTLLSLVAAAILIVPAVGQAQTTASSASMPPNSHVDKPDWWKHSVFYEIYPRSYGDSNNDGTGDLKGITQHLDHLQALGVDAIWITPCFPSPQVDFGYDVSDYRAIDPQYGTLADFDNLVAEGKKRGIKVILDFVVNHSSDKHRWFIESEKSKTNPYHDYYVWRDGKGPDKPPNNWTSIFGGPSWTYNQNLNQWYYHYFYPQQPDLNWRNPKVEKEMFDVTRFWYKRGVYGFRLDAVDTLFEDPKLTDNPPEEGTDAYGMPLQKHVNDKRIDEVHHELQKLRKVADEFPGRVLIGETWTDDPKGLVAYYGPSNNELQMPMFLNLTELKQLDANEFRKRVGAVESNSVGGWPVFVMSNHDIHRSVSRYGDDKNREQVAKLLAAFQMLVRGTPVMYYGEEIGMENHDPTRKEDVKDVIGQKGWPKEKGRDGERTPMQWNDSTDGGFNTGAKPWLPVGDDYKQVNVQAEQSDPNSVLNWYRKMISMRRDNAAISDGDYNAVNEGDSNVYSFVRKRGGKTVLVVLNFSGDKQTAKFDTSALGGSKANVVASTANAKDVDLGNVQLDPYGVLVAEIQ